MPDSAGGKKRAFVTQHEANLGYIYSTSSFMKSAFSFSYVTGARLNRHFYVGAGLTVDYYSGPGEVAIPLFCDLRGYLLKRAASPFVDCRVGYALLYGKMYVSPGVGYCFPIGKEVRLQVQLGYTLQRYKEETIGGDGWTKWKVTSGFNHEGLHLRVGVEI